MIDQVRHGGNLQEAIKQYGGEIHEWLDLSTGISPWPYPIPNIPSDIWRDLPNLSPDLLSAASQYYRCSIDQITVTPGSQLAIRLLPTLVHGKQSVAIPEMGYKEHLHAWKVAGHKLVFYESINELIRLCENQLVTNVVIINPNNPSGEAMSPAVLERLSPTIPGVMIVDEAFMDLNEEYSLLNRALSGNIVVLRSVGKFFGLAGARVGFAIGKHPLNRQLRELFNPWSITGPSQYVVKQALENKQWQHNQRERVKTQSKMFEASLKIFVSAHTHKSFEIVATGLFNTIRGDALAIANMHNLLAQHKVWTRIGDATDERNWLRISLPDNHVFERVVGVLELYS
ncbi:MAG: pyridoxal phosphate-dependent class II aminotransferase [Gammaproteobacteria bacterium]|nr:pyridoxal phosphate-dependent class II aminotransferase [Gammaproteobacteria bacterium]